MFSSAFQPHRQNRHPWLHFFLRPNSIDIHLEMSISHRACLVQSMAKRLSRKWEWSFLRYLDLMPINTLGSTLHIPPMPVIDELPCGLETTSVVFADYLYLLKEDVDNQFQVLFVGVSIYVILPPTTHIYVVYCCRFLLCPGRLSVLPRLVRSIY